MKKFFGIVHNFLNKWDNLICEKPPEKEDLFETDVGFFLAALAIFFLIAGAIEERTPKAFLSTACSVAIILVGCYLMARSFKKFHDYCPWQKRE